MCAHVRQEKNAGAKVRQTVRPRFMTGIPNLETLEAQTLLFLQSAPRPLVSLQRLLSHLNGSDAFSTLSARALTEFIDAHELFSIAHPPEGSPDFFEPAVYLNTRVPSDVEMKAHMALELDTMMKSLEQAHREATAKNDSARSEQIASLLDRAQRLRDSLVRSQLG